MKIETREITVTKEIYVADDGTVFDDHLECKKYEINLCLTSFKMLDSEFEKTLDINDCICVKLETTEEIQKFISCNDYYGLCTEGIRSPGVYVYCSDLGRDGSWVNVGEVMAKFEEASNGS